MPATSIMIQGTTSDAGKSTVALGICRLLLRQGKKVAPFKPQNMALNSAVTADGGEIGRAQALQAVACGVEPHTDMNPVLLKPSSNNQAQVIVQGRVWQNMCARTYHENKPAVMPFVRESFARLCRAYDCVVVEGAGSPAEINLRDNDVANMGFAVAANCPVILVADIDRGGVFAHLYGTFKLLSADEQKLVAGFLINKFRGDPSLLDSGIDWLQKETDRPVFGVLPYMNDLCLDAEDSLSRRVAGVASDVLSEPAGRSNGKVAEVVVVSLPRISNHTDFEPLLSESSVRLRYATSPQEAGACDLIVLPGSKSVVSDLAWLEEQGWRSHILRHLRYGGKLLGICGGLQMLGKRICDPGNVESCARETPGLGLLDMQTEMQADKLTVQVRGHLAGHPQAELCGYEIHMGVSSGPALSRPAVFLERLPAGGESSDNHVADGALSEDGQIMGTYVHGLFDNAAARRQMFAWIGVNMREDELSDFHKEREDSIDRVADAVQTYGGWDSISRLLLH